MKKASHLSRNVNWAPITMKNFAGNFATCSNGCHGAGLGWAGLGWAGLGWAGLGWAGLGWAGLGWAGLGWAGLGWAGLGWEDIFAITVKLIFL